MKKQNRRSSITWLTFAALALAPALPGFGQSYTSLDLGALGGTYSETHGMNSSGNVVGEYEPTNSLYQHAFYYQNGTNSDIGSLGPNNIYAIAYGINDSNVIVGESSPFDPSVDIQAFAYSNGIMRDLGTLGGTNVGGYSSAHGINRLGQIVGESTTSFGMNSPTHAVLFGGAGPTDLGTLGGTYSSANAINSSGVIVGESSLAGGVIHGFIYTNGVMYDLGSLAGPTGYSSAKGVNDSGVIVGESDAVVDGATNLHAFVYRNGVMNDLGTLGRLSSSASAINNLGEIVGYVSNTSQDLNAFFYDGTNLLNLNDYLMPGNGWQTLATGDAINDAGQIAGSGTLETGDYHAYRLTPSGPWIRLISPGMQTNGEFGFIVEGLAGQRFAIACSAGLAPTNWVYLTTNTLSGTSTNFTDSAFSTTGCRFYKALLLP